MKTPVGLRPAAWEPRQRITAAVVALLVVLGASVVWLTGADDRRASAACEFLDDQGGALSTVADESAEAAERAAAASDDTVIGYFNNIDRELGSLRRWQSTYPRLVDALGEETEVGDGIAGDAAENFKTLTEGVAQMQRLIEDAEPADVSAWVPELDARIASAEELCARL